MENTSVMAFTKDQSSTAILGDILEIAVVNNAKMVETVQAGNVVNINFTIDGASQTMATIPVETYQGLVDRVKIVNDLKITENGNQQGTWNAHIANKDITVQAATSGDEKFEKVTLNIS